MFATIPFTRSNGIASRSLGKPAASFPGAIATDQRLAIAVDRLATALASPLDSVSTSMTVVNASAVVANVLLTIDSEIVQVTGPPTGSVVPISRGFDGTTPAVHLASAVVSGFIDAYHHNTLVSEVQAIETALGVNLSAVGSGLVRSAAYNFPAQQPGGSLAAGSNVITLNPAPKGIGVGDTLYISGGTGTPEAATVTGWNPATGQAIVTAAGPHTGAWTIQSATAGIQQALNDSAPACVVQLPGGTVTVQGTVTLKPGCIIQGAGKCDPAFAPSEGTYINATAVISGYVFNYLSPIQTAAYGINSAFILRDFTLGCGLNGVRLNNDTLPTGSNNQGFLVDGVVIENVYFIGGNQCNSDPNKNTATVPTIAALKAYGVAINLNLVFRARILGCQFYYFGVPVCLYGDENLIESCQMSLSSIGVYLNGIDPNGTLPIYGNKNIINHTKLGGLLRLPTIWQDSCGGTIISNNYFEIDPAQYQIVRATNSMKVHIGPGNWYQSPPGATTTPSHHFDLSIEALIHDNDMLEGPYSPSSIEIDYTHYVSKYPNIVRMFGNGSYFPQPGNRAFLGGSTQMIFPQVPGILVLPRNTLLLNAYNNPSDFAYGSTAYPWVKDPTTSRWVLNGADPIINTNGFGVWLWQSGRRYRTFNLYMSARQNGTGVSAVTLSYTGHATTTIFSGNLTFTTTAETSVQSTGNVSIPATETLDGFFLLGFSCSQAMIEQVELVAVS